MGCTSFSKSWYSSVLFCQGCNVKANTIFPSCKRVYLGCHHKKARIIWREGNETLIMLQRSTSVLHNTCIYSTTFAIANCVHSRCRFFSEIFGRQRAWKSTSTWCCGVSWNGKDVRNDDTLSKFAINYVCHDDASWKDLTGLMGVPVTAGNFCSGPAAHVGLWRKPATLHWLRRLDGFGYWHWEALLANVQCLVT